MRTHYLKIEQKYLERILSGQKQFEVRINDRDYQVNDIVRYESVVTGRDVPANSDCGAHFVINYIHSGLGMADKYVVLGIEQIDDDLI